MGEDLTVEHEDGAGHGRYFISLPGNFEAEMTYRKIGHDVIAIDHTYTPPEFRGRNIAFLMLSAGIEDARVRGLRILPLCSYAAIQFKRHPEWSDLLAPGSGVAGSVPS
jgi:predicted GNAT family acetyltransferase